MNTPINPMGNNYPVGVDMRQFLGEEEDREEEKIDDEDREDEEEEEVTDDENE